MGRDGDDWGWGGRRPVGNVDSSSDNIERTLPTGMIQEGLVGVPHSDPLDPQSEFHDLSEPVLGTQTNNGIEAMVCLRVLPRVSPSKDLHAHTGSKCFYDIALCIIQYQARQERTSRWKNLLYCETHSTVTFCQRAGRALRSHQSSHNNCPYTDKADASTIQASVTQLLQLRPCVL